MDKIKVLQGQAATLSLYNTRDKLEELVHKAEQKEISYLTFIENIFNGEIKYRHDKAMAKRIKEAGFPCPLETPNITAISCAVKYNVFIF